jgi:ankyrin repeat protein
MYTNVGEVLARVQHVVEYLDVDLTDINQRGVFGNTPLSVVTSWGDVAAATLLLEAGADVTARIEDGDTVLHRAVLFGDVELAKLFLDAGASPSAKNDHDKTPLDLSRDHDDIRLLLAANGLG